jgi:hypothetical protein
MQGDSNILLVARAFWELLRYDVVMRVWGFRGVHEDLHRTRPRPAKRNPAAQDAIGEAMKWALSLYWKQALCLQRSVAAVRLFRRYGIAANLVIGYRSTPFLSHAWVEVEGRVVNDSPVYQQRLFALDRI